MTNLATKLETSRQALLDLSTRNRLIHIPQNSRQAKVIEVVDELSTEVYRLLVKEEKALSFLPGREKKKAEPTAEQEAIDFPDEDSDIGELPQPEDDEIDDRGVSKRHSDHRLQTILTSEGLQKRLLSLFYDAITFEEEQGVNILYLAVGMLKWFEDDNSTVERCAPLMLIPVSLNRGTAAEKFKIKWRNEEPAANLSLQAKMKLEFGLILPDLPDDDDLDIAAYFKAVQEAVSSKSRFTVDENKITLGFFSFAKFLMYRDLDADNWPDESKIDNHPLIAGLVQDGFPAAEGMIDEDAHVDDHLPVERMFHVVDADSSQTLAIEEVRRGRNLVIQGPPGTGKSQTITNIIASAVKDGKKVLFVAEKMAALEVVQRRMNNIGLGPLCFELHSSKSNKRSVLEDLKRTRDLSRPKSHDGQAATTKLKMLREKLNSHVSLLHEPHTPSNLTPYEIVGSLVHLKEKGIEARGILLEKPETWNEEGKKEREELIEDIASRVREIGVPANHVWRGVNRPSLLPNEYDALNDNLHALLSIYQSLEQDVIKIEQIFPRDEKLHGYKQAKEIAELIARLPNIDCSVLANTVWRDNVKSLEELIENGTKLKKLKQSLSGKIADMALQTSLNDARQQIAMHGDSFTRIFKSGYKQAISLLKSILIIPLPKEHQERLNLIDDILMYQQLEKELGEKDDLGKSAFGTLWQGKATDWAKLSELVQWRNDVPVEKLPDDFFSCCAKVNKNHDWKKLSEKLLKQVADIFDKTKALFDSLKLDIDAAFENATSIEEIGRPEFSSRITSWIASIESISQWINFKTRFDTLEKYGLKVFGEQLWNGNIDANKASDIFGRAYFDSMTETIFTERSDLRDFDGDQHHNHVSNFRENDNYRIEQARIELRCQHYTEMPRSEGGIGPLGVLNGEFAKKRNHLPIRQLLKKAGPAIQALKPIFMMSPLSVAQFLEPGGLEFDLLVIDEASQVEPVDALGAVARAKQIVVVGDTRQLPPTRFFSRVTGNVPDEDEDDDTTTATQDVESILSLCLARGLPQRMLRWHYRSKHQSLIAVSNKQFYNNKLFIIPSPYDAASGMGLKFHYLPDGIFDAGGTSANQVEAKAVAEAVISHAKNAPQQSLGIGTFSVKQRQAILDELELLRRQHPETEPFFNSHSDEPFFVKNLENIQGDERDVIFISIGYGKNKNGYMAMRFGPLSNEGGERRLNVLISRAKRRCEVFSSITADDIDLERAKGAGVASLKMFMKFAQTGKLDYGKMSDREPDSIFEEQVASALRARGYDVKTQIGLAGFFVDLAIVDPDKPGRFLLGIECDGANYHSSRSARDRDRLRQAVLEDHGWIIHRIWSTDWFRRPNEQLDKVLAAIEQAKETLAAQEDEADTVTSRGVFEIATTDDEVIISVSDRELSVLYTEASFSVPVQKAPHEISDNDMAAVVKKIVEIESPIHESEIVTRVRSLWNLSRAGARIQSKVKSGLKLAVRQHGLIEDDDFYLTSGSDVPVRDRSLASPSLRKVDVLPPHEIKKAMKVLIEENYGAGRDQITTEVARLLGFKSTSAQLKDTIEKELNALVETGVLVESDGFLSLVSR